MRITAEFAVRRDDRNGHFYPSVTVTSEIGPEDEERLNQLLTRTAVLLRNTAGQIEEIAQ